MKLGFTYPGWVRKAVTFTIDDGNIPLDRKFIGYVGPAGIRGTFNLCTPLRADMTAQDYRDFYAGYGIADHCRYHAYPFSPARPKANIAGEPYVPGEADPEKLYRTEEEGLYRIRTWGWTYIADDDKYMECVESCRQELEAVFGKGSIKGYVWPNGAQENPGVFRRLCGAGFGSIRATGCVEDSTGFALPADRMAWSYNANYKDMAEVARKYAEYPDDGGLKFFCFGVHSHDFENAGRWDVLEDFCKKFAAGREKYWSAPVDDIFDYEDAVKAVRCEGGRICNPSGLTVYAEADGKRLVLAPGETLAL